MSAVVQLPVPRPRRHVFVAALICALSTLASGGARGATFTVTNTNDSGAGSLRQAITDAVAEPALWHTTTSWSSTFRAPASTRFGPCRSCRRSRT